MSERKGIRKRYLITVSSIILAILSVILLRSFDSDFTSKKTIVFKEINAIMEFNRDYFIKIINIKTPNEKAALLRNEFANKISYKKLLNEKDDFKNFENLPDKNIYGLQLLNNSHVGFYYNNADCGNMNEKKDYCAGIILDVNGYTKPNRFGKDQFLFKLYRDGIKE